MGLLDDIKNTFIQQVPVAPVASVIASSPEKKNMMQMNAAPVIQNINASSQFILPPPSSAQSYSTIPYLQNQNASQHVRNIMEETIAKNNSKEMFKNMSSLELNTPIGKKNNSIFSFYFFVFLLLILLGYYFRKQIIEYANTKLKLKL